MSRIHFLSFYTEGPPYDEAFDLTEQKNILENKIKKYIDTIKFYSYKELNNDPSTKIYIKRFPELAIKNPKAGFLGFFRWKPYIILKTLESEDVRYGDVVYYTDCNVEKYPYYLRYVSDTRKTIDYVLKEHDLFLPIENFHLKIINNVKREVIHEIGKCNQYYLEAPLLNAAKIICRKTDQTIELIRNWLNLCMNDHLISPSHNMKNQYNDFLWHTMDQGVLNVLVRKKQLTQNFINTGYVMKNRLFCIKNLKSVTLYPIKIL